MIGSSSNAQIKNITALLKKSREREKQGVFVIEGRKMFEEALLRRELLVKAYFSESFVEENYAGGIKVDNGRNLSDNKNYADSIETDSGVNLSNNKDYACSIKTDSGIKISGYKDYAGSIKADSGVNLSNNKDYACSIKAGNGANFSDDKNYADSIIPEIPYEIVADNVFAQMSDTVTPQGVLAVVKMPEYSLSELVKKAGTLLFLENLRDPGNLGTILRTAEAAGAAGVILSRESVDVYNPKVIRSTMGAVFRVPFLYVDDFKETLVGIKQQGVRLLAAHLAGKKSFSEADYTGKIGILVGNEANGLSAQVSELADELVKIPMAGAAESLNAAVAAAILLYEAYRSRGWR